MAHPTMSSSGTTTMEEESGKGHPQHPHHFVLVHGVCHGAWCWYKVATLLTSAGHRVTALDMAGCGASPARGEDVASFEDYSRPLLDVVAALPPREQAVLVGHSFGGKSLALAMERFPDRVAAAVFVSAAMPAAGNPMTIILEEFSKETGPDFYMDCAYSASNPECPALETVLLGPEYLAKRLYQLSPPEDLTLAKAMVRPSRSFQEDAMLQRNNVLTAGRYGAVRRVCIVAEDDASWSAEFQRRMASWSPGTEVRGLQGADHMAMLSKPTELSHLLVEVANNTSTVERHIVLI
ncbi:probable esterase PIR7A [Sorghum bicolor]|uniref:AB hydrolase-1 domain-containing protein n=1 Tax=Sorghum bicolor TaxID=4558 RepID=A0A1W0W1A7_SORBI|nr:probable esterase PIR7A [Sorghum bicolor]OQU88164.1 hypothetical protein SORBI_3003G417100 [Sorghum bicolor]|eukprot:XP_002459048.2 probable esterase PIR7A [Sorghum bicolor]